VAADGSITLVLEMWGVYISPVLRIVDVAARAACTCCASGYMSTDDEHYTSWQAHARVLRVLAYIGSTYMLIWYANIPEESQYFIRRNIARARADTLLVRVPLLHFHFLFCSAAAKKGRRHLLGPALLVTCRRSISTS